jgi:rhomboid protease GluP
MTADAAQVTPAEGPQGRLLAAVLAVAEQRGTTALAVAMQPPVAVVSLPEEQAGVALLERGQLGAEALRDRLERLLSGHEAGLLFVVLVGGDAAADGPVLQAADRKAPDPRKLGLYQLDDQGRLAHVCGRRLGLLAAAARLYPKAVPLMGEQIAAGAERARQAHEEAFAYSQALNKRPRHATRILAGACIGYFLLWMVWRRVDPLAVFYMGANSAPLVRAGQFWRLLSHAFLHANELHLIVNMVGLISFGGFLERVFGWRRYLLLYGVSALAGGVASALIGGVELSVGASGAIWGLMGAGLGLVLGRQRLLPGLMRRRLRPQLLGLLALNVGLTLLPIFVPSVHIDYLAHLGGGLLGFALVASGWLIRGLPAADGASEPVVFRLGALLMAASLALSLAVALASGKPWKPKPPPVMGDQPKPAGKTEL